MTRGWTLAGEFPVPSNVLESNTEYRYRVTVKDANDGWLGNDTKKVATNADVVLHHQQHPGRCRRRRLCPPTDRLSRPSLPKLGGRLCRRSR